MCMLRFLQRSAIRFTAMSDAVDRHTLDAILDRVQNAITTDAKSVRIGISLEFFGVGSSRTAGKSLNCVSYLQTDLLRQMAKLTSRSRGVEDAIHGVYVSARRELSPWGSVCRAGEL